MMTPRLRRSALVLAALVPLAACGDGDTGGATTNDDAGGAADAGGSADAGAGHDTGAGADTGSTADTGASTDTGAGADTGGGQDDCPDEVFLDLSTAPGAGAGYAAAWVDAYCEGDNLIVDSNGMPHYTFVPITPNALVEADNHFVIPRYPQVADAPTDIPLLGTAGFAVNGTVFFGPNEGAQPAAEAFGDPVYNGIMDECLGHTAFEYHFHAFVEKCLIPSGLVAEPWRNADPDPSTPSPVLGFAWDGFPIYGSRGCVDAECTDVVEYTSGWVAVGDPTMNAWDNYEYRAVDSPTVLDQCNGHVGPGGDYHYHATAGFPYIIGCYSGTPADGTGVENGGGGGGGGTGQPTACTSSDECAGECPEGSMGCTCAPLMGGDMGCVPTCTTDDDCPTLADGTGMMCGNGGVCIPAGGPPGP